MNNDLAQVGEVVLTSNDLNVRSAKMMIGRIVIIVKEHAGYEESSSMYVALKNLAALNKALKDNRKVMETKPNHRLNTFNFSPLTT